MVSNPHGDSYANRHTHTIAAANDNRDNRSHSDINDDEVPHPNTVTLPHPHFEPAGNHTADGERDNSTDPAANGDGNNDADRDPDHDRDAHRHRYINRHRYTDHDANSDRLVHGDANRLAIAYRHRDADDYFNAQRDTVDDSKRNLDPDADNVANHIADGHRVSNPKARAVRRRLQCRQVR